MPKVKLDLTGVKAGGEPIPEGVYAVEVVDGDIREGKDSGLPYLWLHLKVAEGEYENRRLFYQGSLGSEQSLGITMASVNALLGRDVTGQEYELDTDDLISLKAMARVAVEEPGENAPEGAADLRNVVKHLKPLTAELQAREDEAGERPWA